MSLVVNLRHLADHELRFEGELSAAELELDTRDEAIRVSGPLKYNVEVQRMEQSLLARGELNLKLDCECVRCLKSFQTTLKIADWICDVPLEGDEKVPIVSDCVDLTPYLREDILLALPQHPLCKPECGGIKNGRKIEKSSAAAADSGPSPWTELDKLEL